MMQRHAEDSPRMHPELLTFDHDVSRILLWHEVPQEMYPKKHNIFTAAFHGSKQRISWELLAENPIP